jgi:hypothetical protein
LLIELGGIGGAETGTEGRNLTLLRAKRFAAVKFLPGYGAQAACAASACHIAISLSACLIAGLLVLPYRRDVSPPRLRRGARKRGATRRVHQRRNRVAVSSLRLLVTAYQCLIVNISGVQLFIYLLSAAVIVSHRLSSGAALVQAAPLVLSSASLTFSQRLPPNIFPLLIAHCVPHCAEILPTTGGGFPHCAETCLQLANDFLT